MFMCEVKLVCVLFISWAKQTSQTLCRRGCFIEDTSKEEDSGMEE